MEMILYNKYIIKNYKSVYVIGIKYTQCDFCTTETNYKEKMPFGVNLL